jgi:hypothetical protein
MVVPSGPLSLSLDGADVHPDELLQPGAAATALRDIRSRFGRVFAPRSPHGGVLQQTLTSATAADLASSGGGGGGAGTGGASGGLGSAKRSMSTSVLVTGLGSPQAVRRIMAPSASQGALQQGGHGVPPTPASGSTARGQAFFGAGDGGRTSSAGLLSGRGGMGTAGGGGGLDVRSIKGLRLGGPGGAAP